MLKMVDLVSTSEDIKEAISESLKYFFLTTTNKLYFPDVRDLKPEQRLIVEHVVRRKDVFAALPTGFAKSLTFQILPVFSKCCLTRVFTCLHFR